MKKILFVGASGMVANILLPKLSETYSIIGISARRNDLASYCEEHILADLTKGGGIVLPELFLKHEFDIVIWNAVRYFKTPLLGASRLTLLTEFDLAVALPVECVRLYAKADHAGRKKKFIAMASKSAFAYQQGLTSYGIVKQAQITLMDYLAKEVPSISFTAVAPSNVQKIDQEKFCASILRCIEQESGTLVTIDRDID